MKIKKHRKRLITILIIFLFFVFVSLYGHLRCRKAVSIAEDYLSKKYEKEMKNVSVRYSFIDPCLYHVYFSPEDNPELTFEVLVQNDLSIANIAGEFGEETGSADNYYIKYFEHELEQELKKEAGEILDENTKITVLHSSSGMYSFFIPDGLNENVSLKDMLEIVDGRYYIYVEFPEEDVVDINSEKFASAGLEFLEMVKSKYNPLNIFIQFWIDGEKDMISTEFNNKKDIETVAEFKRHLKLEVEYWLRIKDL